MQSKIIKLEEILKDATLKDSVLINFSDSIPINNFKVLGFRGTADGTSLTRVYNINDIQNYFVRLISIHLFFFSDNSAFWIREAAYDNTTYTTNSNARYSLSRPYTRLDPIFLSELNTTAQTLKILINQNDAHIFPGTYLPAIDKLDLNVIPNVQIQDGIDVQAAFKFYSNVEANTETAPFVVVLMPVEILPIGSAKLAVSFK